ncbi:MAG: MFS transporter [Bryobacterales bacterium]|nr:MFS transporter [Bryobacterales bacterium]
MSQTSLWRQPDFVKLWAGQAISEIGSRVSREGIPLTAVLVLHATTVEMGWLVAISGMAAFAAGPLVGPLADRLRRRPLMIAADLARAAVLLSIPWMHFQHTLTMPHLLAVAALTGALTVLFDVAYPTYVPTLVRPAELLEANGKLALTLSVAEVTGPALTGLLVKWITAPVAILLDAVSFVISAVAIAAIQTPETAPEPASAHEDWWSEARAGIHFVFSHALLRPLALRAATVSLAWGFFGTLYVYYAVTVLKMSTVALGIVITLGGIGNLAGALAARWLSERYPVGRVLIGAALWQGVLSLLVPAAAHADWTAIALLGAAQLFGDVAYPVYNINELTLRQQIAPPHLLGRVNACQQLLIKGLFPLGALLGGALASAAGARAVLLASSAAILLSAVWLIASPVRKLQAHRR